jgi:hypothetical protein
VDHVFPVFDAVEEKSVEYGNVRGMPNRSQESLRELEVSWTLAEDLPHAVKEEQEHRALKH